jgi:hypothetical protein
LAPSPCLIGLSHHRWWIKNAGEHASDAAAAHIFDAIDGALDDAVTSSGDALTLTGSERAPATCRDDQQQLPVAAILFVCTSNHLVAIAGKLGHLFQRNLNDFSERKTK